VVITHYFFTLVIVIPAIFFIANTFSEPDKYFKATYLVLGFTEAIFMMYLFFI
jgi:hypothetical protein